MLKYHVAIPSHRRVKGLRPYPGMQPPGSHDLSFMLQVKQRNNWHSGEMVHMVRESTSLPSELHQYGITWLNVSVINRWTVRQV